jgi:hypothetical protein
MRTFFSHSVKTWGLKSLYLVHEAHGVIPVVISKYKNNVHLFLLCIQNKKRTAENKNEETSSLNRCFVHFIHLKFVSGLMI